MSVTFSRRAQRELDGILDELMVRASRHTAERMLDRIEQRALSLGLFPERGARISILGLEALRFVVEAPYLIVYRVSASSVEVVAVLHGARDIKADLSSSIGDS